MDPTSPNTITRLLKQARDGDDDALTEVWQRLYEELRRVAHHLMQGESMRNQIDATELIAEIWLRGRSDSELPENRREFFSRAFKHMAQEVVDQARRRNTLKRGSNWSRCPLEIVPGELSELSTSNLERQNAAAEIMLHWHELHEEHPLAGDVAFCRLVLGLRNDETACALELDPERAKGQWRFAKAKLRSALEASSRDE